MREGHYRSGVITLKRGDEETGSLTITVNTEGPWKSYIKFDYLLGYDKKPVVYEHKIELFPCNYGGHRFYFRCRHCGRRVTALYLSGGYYACRYCHELTYEARQRHRGPFETLGRAFHFSDKAEELQKRGHPRKASRLLERSHRLFQLGGAELLARDKLELARKRKKG